MKYLVVTRHPALVAFLRERGYDVSRVVEHATVNDVQDQHIIGVLPYHLACRAKTVTTVELEVPVELRGVELTLAQVKQYAGRIRTYTVYLTEELYGMIAADCNEQVAASVAGLWDVSVAR